MKLKLSMFDIQSKKLFLGISLAVTAVLFAFHYWLYWPGYIQDDSQTTFLLLKSGWHPVIMAYLIEGMYKLFGYHIYHLFLLTLLPFYLGMWIVVYVASLKTKSWLSLLWFFPFTIGNLFYALIKLGSSSFSGSWVFLLYALTLAMILTLVCQKWKKSFYTFYGLVFVVALLSRHNAIFQVWPVTFVWIAMFLSAKELSFWKYVRQFIGWAFLSGLGCSVLLIGLNKALISSDEGNSYPATLIVMHQIVGACAPDMDETCYRPEWWSEKWSQYDSKERMLLLKRKYEDHAMDAEAFSLSYDPDVVFKYFTDLKGHFERLFYAIRKHPQNYYEHINHYFIRMWGLWPNLVSPEKLARVYSEKSMIRHSTIWNPTSEREKEQFYFIAKQMPKNEMTIAWTENQRKIDKFLREDAISLDIIWFIRIAYILLAVGVLVFIKNRNNLMNMLLIAVSGSGFFTALVMPFISPRVYVRYMEPMIFCSVFALGLVLLMAVMNKDEICRFTKKCYGWLKLLYSETVTYWKN
ncbi:MAG: hypothetical protein MJ210_00055 [Alphaproteobacteria bacterium]|nr:hypothetical protein [Alphaproteobacteria bacterium]